MAKLARKLACVKQQKQDRAWPPGLKLTCWSQRGRRFLQFSRIPLLSLIKQWTSFLMVSIKYEIPRENFHKALLQWEQQPWAFRTGDKVTHPTEVNGPGPPLRRTRGFYHAALWGMLPNESKLTSAPSVQKAGIMKSFPVEGSSGCLALSMKWFLIIWYWLSSQEIHDSSLLLFHVVFPTKSPNLCSKQNRPA